MKWRSSTIALLILAVVALAFGLGRAWSQQQEWFDLQHRQMATILRLQQLPPSEKDADAWSNEIVTLHNVWGNVTFTPSYCGLSNEEMQALLSALDQMVSETTTDNCDSTVDRIYEILLARAKNPRFVSGYRDEFRATLGKQP